MPERLGAEVMLLRERTHRVSVTAVTRGAARVLVCARDPGAMHEGCCLPLEDAVRAVAQPLHVLVEHQVNDAAFLRYIMPPVWRERLEAWERRGELRYENGGGLAVMTALVDFHCQDEHARLAFGLPAAVWRLVHFIVYDHDGDQYHLPGEQSRRLESSCNSAGMVDRCHRLQRRDQEHYLPVEALRQIVEERVTNPEDRAHLLADIDAHVAKDDTRHFAPLPQLGRDPFFKNKFAKQSASPWADDWFERDGAWAEMTRLAERIASAM